MSLRRTVGLDVIAQFVRKRAQRLPCEEDQAVGTALAGHPHLLPNLGGVLKSAMAGLDADGDVEWEIGRHMLAVEAAMRAYARKFGEDEAIVGGFGTGAAQPALMTQAVDRSDGQRRGQSLAQFQFFYDLGIGVGSLTMGALLDLVDQSFLIMYLATAGVALIGLWINWRGK